MAVIASAHRRLAFEQFAVLIPLGVLAVHHTYFGLVSSWTAPMQGTLLLTVAAAIALSHPRGTVRAATMAHAGFTIAVFLASLAVNSGLVDASSRVTLPWGEIRQWSALGLIPSTVALALLVGVPLHRSTRMRAFISVVVVINGSVSGWLGLPVALWGLRGLPLSAVVYLACMPMGGDVGFKTTTRLVSEMEAARPAFVQPVAAPGPPQAAVAVATHPWPYWMADLTAIALLLYAGARRHRSLGIVAAASFRFGSTLWFSPLGIAIIGLALALDVVGPMGCDTGRQQWRRPRFAWIAPKLAVDHTPDPQPRREGQGNHRRAGAHHRTPPGVNFDRSSDRPRQ